MMEGPADTLNYMIAGYVVIFGILLIYLVSLIVCWKNLLNDEKMLKELDKTE
jgi:hypothetical protein